MWQTRRVTHPRSLALLAAGLLLVGCSASPQPSFVSTSSASAAPGTTTCDYQVTGTPAKPVQPPPTTASTIGTATLTLTMSGGTVTITGERAATPCTWNSMESLAGQGWFNDTGCHRLADSGMYMIQCGDPTGTGSGTPGYQFADELTGSETYSAGTVAMANAGAGTNSNGSQFFLVYEDSPLPANYTVWGHVDAASLKVIKTMAADGHDNSYGDGTGRPKTAFRIVTAKAS